VDAEDRSAETHCFTSAYGRSVVRSGSYLRTRAGVRRFSPHEIVRLLGFPEQYQLPEDWPARRLWPLVGNSLSVAAVRYVLRAIPELAGMEA
jgi:site-specific DNA-cytosine methylase